MKACSRCGVEQYPTEFHRSSSAKDGLHAWCKSCVRQYHDERKKRPEVQARNMAYSESYEKTEKAAEVRRRYRLKARFNLTPEEYDIILASQNGRCAICQGLPGQKRLAVDHDHKTGLVRGLLCWGCNAALGKFRDDTERLQRAAEYVMEPPATSALSREVYGQKGRVTNKKRRARKARRRST